MPSFNKVVLIGHLTRDPELRYTPNGAAVCEFGMATNRTYKTADGEKRQDTCFVTVTMWGKRGGVINEYLSKGDPILVEGRLNYDSWDSPEGRRSRLTVAAENFEFMGSGDGGRGADYGDDSAPEGQGLPDVPDDEIPF